MKDILFNVDKLCPMNAPKRYEWCKGLYHICKCCPKLATLDNENEKRQRMNKTNENLQWNNKQKYHLNKTYSYNENFNRRTYSKLASVNHQQRPYQYRKKPFKPS